MLDGAKIRTISGTTKFFLDYFGIVRPADETAPTEKISVLSTFIAKIA